MASPQVSTLHPRLEPGVRPRVGPEFEPVSRSLRRAPTPSESETGRPSDSARLPREAGVLGELDLTLSTLCREAGPLRAVLAHLAHRLDVLRAWERLGFARLSDYASERLGLSGRTVRSLAEVGACLRSHPYLEHALVSGTLGWTKVRLLARLSGSSMPDWIAYARKVTASELSRSVRAVDRGSVEDGADGLDPSGAQSRLFEVRCTPEVRWKWGAMKTAASRVAGRAVHVSEAAELVAAEVLSAFPLDDDDDAEGACDDEGVSQTSSWSSPRACAPPFSPGPGSSSSPVSPFPSAAPREVPARLPCSYPPALRELLDGLDQADAFLIDERLCRALSLERSLDARIGPLLAHVWNRFVHRALGFLTREAYARERLGMDVTRARALVRLERACAQSGPFAQAYRSGALSSVKASRLVPLVEVDPLGTSVEGWVEWAGRATVRRLDDDVERALALAETQPGEFARTGGLPAEAHDSHSSHHSHDSHDSHLSGDREIGAVPTASEEESQADPDREIGAPPTAPEEDPSTRGTWLASLGPDREIGAAPTGPEGRGLALRETCWARFIGPPDVVQLFKAVLCTVRRRIERETGRLPTSGEALGTMLDHAFGTWGFPEERVAARYKIYARDGWRCAVPGCSSHQNLHDHHIHFRSAGGSDDPSNRVTLCAFHHLRGVHAGLLRCTGKAPDGLRWELGIRPGITPLLAYRSGDVRIRSALGGQDCSRLPQLSRQSLTLPPPSPAGTTPAAWASAGAR